MHTTFFVAVIIVSLGQQPTYTLRQAPGYPAGWTYAPTELTPQEITRRAFPYGGDGARAFVGLLNVERGKYGLGGVVLDQSYAGQAWNPAYVSSSIKSPVAALDAWLHSPMHRAALMRSDLVSVAVNWGPSGTAATGRAWNSTTGQIIFPTWPAPKTPAFMLAMMVTNAAVNQGRGW